MKAKLSKLFALAVILIASPSLFAHHGNSSFDSGKQLTMRGTVTEWIWANPHCFLRFDVKDDHGQAVHWSAEGRPPVDMLPTGWTHSSFKPGDQVTVTLEPVKNGQPVGRMIKVVLPSGQTLGF